MNILSGSQRGRDALITKIRQILFLADQPPDEDRDEAP